MQHTSNPKTELTDDERNTVKEAAGLGMPWKLIAGLIELTLDQLQSLRRTDPVLAAQVRKAEAICMQALLKKLADAEQWQAVTFVLESRWPANFGRNRKPRKKKKADPPITQEMLNRLAIKEVETFLGLLDKMHAAPDAAVTPEIPAPLPAEPGGHQRQLDGPQPAPLCPPGVEGA